MNDENKAGPYSIGSDRWPGLSKLTEESGELLQVIGKILATNGERQHWDGADLQERFEEELADVIAAIRFVMMANSFDIGRINERAERKFSQFLKWHEEQKRKGVKFIP